jgi:phage/plasmid-like protein (TIGR03299 family)
MTSTLESPAPAPALADYAEQGGEKMFSSRRLPWAKIGTVIDDPSVDAATAAQLGGLDFDVELRSVRYNVVNADGIKSTKTIPNRKAVVRVGTDEFFDVVSTKYVPVQYRDAFSFLDGIHPRYVSAGTMGGGKQGFMVIQLPGAEDVSVDVNGVNDPHMLYVIVRTSHDRSKALEVAVMPLRGLCMNMLGLPSLTRGAEQRWSFKHVGDVAEKLEQAQATLLKTEKYVDAFRGTVRQLASVTLDGDDVNTILKRVLPDRPMRDDAIAAITASYTDSPAVGFTGTGWGLTNAVSEYFQWGRNEGSRTDQSMFTSALSGDTRKYVGRTAQLLLTR